MTLEEFQADIRSGIPDILPEPKPYDTSINHAPRRKDILTEEEKVLALKNALRYFPAKHHALLAREFAGELPHFKPESGIGGHRLKKSRRRFFRRGITDFAQDIGKLKGRNQLCPDFIRQLKREISLVPLRERDENTFSFIRDFDTAVVEVQRHPFRRGGQGQRQPAERDVRGAGHLGILPAVRREHGADCRFVVTFPGGAEIVEILPGRPAHATPVVPEGACPDGDVDRVAFAPDREAEFAIAGGRTHVNMGKWKGVGDFHIQTPTPFFRRIFPYFAISPVTTTAKACRAAAITRSARAELPHCAAQPVHRRQLSRASRT